MGGSVGMGGWKSKKRRENRCLDLPIVNLCPTVAQASPYYAGVRNPRIKHPLLPILALLAAWLGMTWWLHGDRKPGEQRRNYSDVAP